jgi:hypothetical protein
VLAPIALAQASETWGKFGPNEVPFRKNPEQQNFTETSGNSQGDFGVACCIYRF